MGASFLSADLCIKQRNYIFLFVYIIISIR